MLDRLEREEAASVKPTQPRVGWFGRRRRNLPPARQEVDRLPTGPASRSSGNNDVGPAS